LPHRWPGPPIAGTLIERPNKFLAICRLDGSALVVEAHVPDRGRCLDLLLPGQPMVLIAAEGPLRKTKFTAVLAEAKSAPGVWVCLDPAGAPRLVKRALELGMIAALAGWTVVGQEVAIRRAGVTSRIDLLLEKEEERLLCEVKSVGAALNGVALFPDAPTERGTRHLSVLAARSRKGERSAVVLCAQRGDVTAIWADKQIDPVFARSLQRARRAGVIVAGLVAEALPEGMRLLREVNVPP